MKKSQTTTGNPPDVLAAGDALQAHRAAVTVEQATERLAETMAEFDTLETEVYPRVAPLGADFARWRRDYTRRWVREEPGLENELSQLDTWLPGGRFVEQFPEQVAAARALYANLTVEGLRRGDEARIGTLLGHARNLEAVENYHRCAAEYVKTIEATLARRIAAGTLQAVGPAVGADSVTSPASRPRRAQGALSGDDE